MSITQFMRILWARRLFIIVSTASALLGGILIILIVPPRWEANARVMLNLLKPDPVTGQVLGGPATRAYVATQTELITDYSVAGQVADQLGWLSDPTLIAAYRSRPKQDVRDFRHYLADRVISATRAHVVEGSNILDITYTGSDPSSAKTIVEALRKSYLDASLAYRRDEAMRNAAWYETQAAQNKKLLDQAEAEKAAYERQNGIVLQDDKIDTDSARLRALSQQTGALTPQIAPPPQVSAAAMELAQLDAAINLAQQNLGPNHPQLREMRSKREALASLVAQERNAKTAQQAAAAAAESGVRALDRAVQSQKARVIAERDKIGRLMQLQTDVDLKREQYNKTAARAAELRQEAAVADTGLTALGNAVAPRDPKFPKVPLILVGALALGAGAGTLLGLLAEFLARRVRSAEDLTTAVDVPVLALIPGGEAKLRVRRMRGRPTLFSRKPVQA